MCWCRVPMEEEEVDEVPESHDSNLPFSVLMQQACTIKSKQNEVFRRKYDTWPSWLQHTMFSSEEIIRIRSLPYSERMKSALEYKQQGNESLQNSEYYEAIHHYETAMSIFHWIVNKKDNWKRQEIEDDMLEMFEYCPETGQELNEVQELKCSCLLNIALASQKLQQWSECIKACTAVLEINPNSTKAYYRRAQARLLPIQCGATENEMALQDLKKAYDISPNDPVISKLYFQVKKDLEEQKKKDLQTFGGLFDRGTIYQEGDIVPLKGTEHPVLKNQPGTAQETMTVGDALQKIRDMESAAKTLYRDGKLAESRELEEKARSLRKEIEEFQQSTMSKKRSDDWLNVDYSNPTPETIEAASKMGLDLKDPRVVAYLEEVQKDLRKREVQGHHPDTVLESIESVHQEQLKQTATFICDGWAERELDSFVKYRVLYQQSTGSSNTNFILAKWDKYLDLNSKRELLIQSMMSDLVEAEAVGDDGGAVVKMLNERYGLHEIEKEQKLRIESSKSSQFWLTFILSGLFFFALLFIPRYLRSCERLCTQDDCSSFSSFCSVYFHLFSSLPTDLQPASSPLENSSSPTDDDLF